MGVIEEDMRACGVNKNMVWDRERWWVGIRVVDPPLWDKSHDKKDRKITLSYVINK